MLFRSLEAEKNSKDKQPDPAGDKNGGGKGGKGPKEPKKPKQPNGGRGKKRKRQVTFKFDVRPLRVYFQPELPPVEATRTATLRPGQSLRVSASISPQIKRLTVRLRGMRALRSWIFLRKSKPLTQPVCLQKSKRAGRVGPGLPW